MVVRLLTAGSTKTGIPYKCTNYFYLSIPLSVVSRDFLFGTNSRTVTVNWQPVGHIQLEVAEAQSVLRSSISLPTPSMNQKVWN